MILLIQCTTDPVKKQKETLRRRTKSPEDSKHKNSDELFQELGDSPLQPRLSLYSSVGRDLPVDIFDIIGTISDAQTQFSRGQLVALPEAKPSRPAFVDHEIVLALRPGRQWPERGVDRVGAEAVDVVETRQADIVGPHRDSELYVAITQDVPGNRMHRMPVGMRLKLRTPISECRHDVHEMMRLD